VKLNRFGKVLGTPLMLGVSVTTIAALSLTACGSDNNSGSSSSSAASGS